MDKPFGASRKLKTEDQRLEVPFRDYTELTSSCIIGPSSVDLGRYRRNTKNFSCIGMRVEDWGATIMPTPYQRFADSKPDEIVERWEDLQGPTTGIITLP